MRVDNVPNRALSVQKISKYVKSVQREVQTKFMNVPKEGSDILLLGGG